MIIHFDYGRDGLDVDIPDANLLGVVRNPLPKVAESPPVSVRAALHEPVGGLPLAELAKGRASACVVIPDVTRPLPLQSILPDLLAELEANGISRERILILIATGLHRPNEGAELEEMLGPSLVRDYRIENHVATDAGAHVDLGVTTHGVPAHVDRRLVEADLKIVIGLVEPHFMAGYSGGRKLVCPGVCAEATIRAFHGYEILSSERASNCVLDDNPVHETSTEVAKMVGIDFSVNVVIDDKRTLRAVHAGALEPAFLAACDTAARLTTFPVTKPADIVIVSGGGYPLDATWYQSVKGLVAAEAVVRPGGVIILATGLQEGVGSDSFGRLLSEVDSLDAFLGAIQSPDYYRREQWQLQMFARVARKARVLVFSDSLTPERSEEWFVEAVPTVEHGIERALSDLGPQSLILAMPHGPYVMPVCTAG